MNTDYQYKVGDTINSPDLGSVTIEMINGNYKPGPKIYLDKLGKRWCTIINGIVSKSHSFEENDSIEGIEYHNCDYEEDTDKPTFFLFKEDTYIDFDNSLVKIVSVDNIQTVWYTTSKRGKPQKDNIYSKDRVYWIRIKNGRIITPPTNTICDEWFYVNDRPNDPRIVEPDNLSMLVSKDEFLHLPKLKIIKRPVISIDVYQNVWYLRDNILYWQRFKDKVAFSEPSKLHKFWNDEPTEEFINFGDNNE